MFASWRQVQLAVLLALAASPSAGWSQGFVEEHIQPVTLVVEKVEEDWELRIGTPSPNVTAPQVTTAISPTNGLEGLHAIFNLNHQALEEFAPGGMQLQVWNGETPISHYRLRPDEVLSEEGEVVTWTQTMELTSTGLVFRIENGESETWGRFGGTNLLTERVATSLTDLNGYNPLASVENSGVVFAANRVDALVLKTVRIYTTDGQIFVVPLNMNAHTTEQ